jgi:hypothetical protein
MAACVTARMWWEESTRREVILFGSKSSKQHQRIVFICKSIIFLDRLFDRVNNYFISPLSPRNFGIRLGFLKWPLNPTRIPGNDKKWISDEQLEFTWNSWLKFQVSSRSPFWTVKRCWKSAGYFQDLKFVWIPGQFQPNFRRISDWLIVLLT